LTGVIKTLQTRKLIRRLPHKEDRRRVSIELTTSGEHLIEALFPKFNQHERVAVASLTLSEQRELARLLRKVTHGVASSHID
jgi:MarR family 2-MHQ and catechol resistance regulon transcriptional repressor